MAARPFAPGLDAAPKSNGAAAYSPFHADLTRPQGQQELKAIDVTLPPGATAKLKGIPYCPPAAIAAAAGRAGAAERQSPSCPAASHVGVASIRAGTGSAPLQIDGDVYLAGPYQGAPLSLAVLTPALAGPFDLGTVVVRVALYVDPETAQVRAVAEIPDVFGGAKLDIRSIFGQPQPQRVHPQRDQLRRAGDHRDAGRGRGGPDQPGGLLLVPGLGPVPRQRLPPAQVQAAAEAEAVRRHPPHPAPAPAGGADRAPGPGQRRPRLGRPAARDLPRPVEPRRRLHRGRSSPPNSARRARSTATRAPSRRCSASRWKGPVVLRSNPAHTLPDMVAHLRGQVTIDLVGRIDSFKGGIRTTFDHVPDVPVKKFVLNLPGGKHGLLVASTNLCRGRRGRSSGSRATTAAPPTATRSCAAPPARASTAAPSTTAELRGAIGWAAARGK